MKDKVGNEIPKRLENSFMRGDLRWLISEHVVLSERIIRSMDQKDELFIGIKRAAFEAICSDMQNILKAEVPYAVCPFCKADGCKACLGRGWLGKFRYDATASARKE